MPNLTPQKVHDQLVEYQDKFIHALPEYMDINRMFQVVKSEVSNNSKLLQCDPKSILQSAYEACYHGVEPSQITGHGSLVPYGRTCKFILGYRGIVELANRAGHTIWGYEICENDPVAEVRYGTNPEILHTKLLHGNRGKMIGAYAVADLGEGRPKKYHYMTIEELREHSKYSKTPHMWKKHPEAMAIKTCIRMLGKTLGSNPMHNKLNGKLTDQERFDLAVRSSDVPNQGLNVDLDSGEFEYIDQDPETNPDLDSQPETKKEKNGREVVRQKPSFGKQENSDKKSEGSNPESKSKQGK